MGYADEWTMQEQMGQGEMLDAVAIPVPPPPPRFDPRPTLWQQRLLLLLVGAGLVLVALGYALDVGIAKQLQRGGFFMACYALVVAASWLPSSILSRRVDAFLDRWVKNGASGFYGMMALATYAHLELRTLVEAIADFELSSDWLRDAAIQAVTGFSIDSLMNFVWAMAWPSTLWGRGTNGLAPVFMVAAAWSVYELGRRVLPQTALHRSTEPGQR